MFNLENVVKNSYNLKIYKSDIFSNSISHFFTTRIGGDTPYPLNSFTISAKDELELVDYEYKNKKIICEILNSNYENLICPNQQHTDNIAIIKNQNDIKQLNKIPFDGVITNLQNYPVCLVFADCVPVLLFDEKQKVFSCIHAGWKGTAKKIAVKAVNIMKEEFNSNINDIKVAIGPAICAKCYEVNKDVATQLASTLKNNYDNIFMEQNNKINVDLKKINEMQLTEKGIKKIDNSLLCTSCNNDLFYSYRAENKKTGRHAMIAIIKE